MSRLHAVAAALGIVIWGTQFVVANAAMEHMSPYLLVALRFLPLAIIALAVVPKPKVSWWVIIGAVDGDVGGGVVQGSAYGAGRGGAAVVCGSAGRDWCWQGRFGSRGWRRDLCLERFGMGVWQHSCGAGSVP